MKRKGRSPTEEQREACGIWLDTLALKNRKLQTRIAKPTLSMQNRPLLHPSLGKVPLPFTKQTTISSFFTSQPGDEKKANTNAGLAGAASSKSNCKLQGHEWLEGERSQLAASFSPQVQEFKHHAHQTSAPSNRRWMDQAKGGKHTIEDDGLGFSQHTAFSRSPLRDKNGGWRISSTPFSQTCQNLRRDRSCSSYSKSRLSDPSDSENTDPQLETSGTALKLKSFQQNIIGIPSETVMAPCTPDKEPENTQLGCPASLFSQDSEGHRVISHPFSGEQGNLCLLKKPLLDTSNRGTGPAHRNCFGACFPAESGPQIPGGAEITQDSCYDLLFTEDSEGNRVIKH